MRPIAKSASVAHADATNSTSSIEAPTHAPRIGGLDFIRALSISAVIWGHAIDGREYIGKSLSGLGVTAFFVLSGFLITRLLQDEFLGSGRIDLMAFYRRRIARLLPVFYLFLLLGIAVALLRDRPVPWYAVLSSVFYYTNYYQAFTGAETNFVSHCWSLAVEEQFYMLWPLLLVLLARRNISLHKALLVFVLTVCLWRWWLVLRPEAPIDYLYRALETRGDSLAVGCLLAVLMRSDRWQKRLAEIAGQPGIGYVSLLLLLVFSGLENVSPQLKYGVSFVFEPFLIALLILIAMRTAASGKGLARIVNNGFMVHVGRVSYSMYLFHGFIGYTAHRLVEAATNSFWLALVAQYLVIVLFSTILFRWFEVPVKRFILGEVSRDGFPRLAPTEGLNK